MRAIASCLPLVFLSLCGCARKLPGPAECRAFALASIGVEQGTTADQLATVPQLEERAETITVKCLTTPWDYELLSCLARGGSTQVCGRSFQARQLTQ